MQATEIVSTSEPYSVECVAPVICCFTLGILNPNYFSLSTFDLGGIDWTEFQERVIMTT